MKTIVKLLGEQESLHLEFKQKINDGVYKTVAAFANTDGGSILVGVPLETLGYGFVLIMREPVAGGQTEPVKVLGESSQKILKILKRNPETTIAELSEWLGITDRAVKKNLTTLKKSGAVKRIGPAKGGHWEVVE